MEDQDYVLANRRLVMFTDLNAAGRLFGGRLMAWVDEATAMVAMGIMGTRHIVTKKFGEFIFDAPGVAGDFIEIWCRPLREGNTSLTLDCRVTVRDVRQRDVHDKGARQICSSNVVFVALDEKGRPRPWKKKNGEE